MSIEDEYSLFMTRRQFFCSGSTGIGLAALGSLLKPSLLASSRGDSHDPGLYPIGNANRLASNE